MVKTLKMGVYEPEGRLSLVTPPYASDEAVLVVGNTDAAIMEFKKLKKYRNIPISDFHVEDLVTKRPYRRRT